MLCEFVSFYARQLYRQVLLRARISYGNSVCLSVCPSVTTRYGFKAR